MLHGRQVQDIIKIAAEDTTLTVSNTKGGKTTFPVPSGTEIEFHVPGLHYNRALRYVLSLAIVLMQSHSTVLAGPSQVYAREVSR
jgi:hypothetical protein